MKNVFLWMSLGTIFFFLFQQFNFSAPKQSLDYTAFITSVNQGLIEEVIIDGYTIEGKFKNGTQFETVRPPIIDFNLIDELLKNNVRIVGALPQSSSILRQLFIATFPIVIIFLLLMYLMKQQTGGGKSGGLFGFSKSKAKLNKQRVTTRFKDVAGIEESKEDVKEVVDYLVDSSKFTELGGKVPKGILMSGLPGTGKTLLAKAIAGEANVPFFSISGSDFVEMFVGVGAARVRDMFEQARKSSPCIIFIDEIDAVGRHRGAGLGGGHDEREQTLNQILVEMDGFEENSGIIIIAATNRPDVLDPALLRPGRFDRQIYVQLPDIKGREAILNVHKKNKKLSPTVKLRNIARGTPGFSGADLANLLNESAILAGRKNSKEILDEHIEEARDKILMGPERKTFMMSDEEKSNTAHHESGHAIIGYLMPEHDPVHKVTIIPRGRALGFTMFLPERDKISMSKQALISSICGLFGGRVAEQLTLGEDRITTGASNDIERATTLARDMVTKWGYSEELGVINYTDQEEQVFLGKSAGKVAKHLADSTTEKIDLEVKRIVDECYNKTLDLINTHMDKLKVMAQALLKYETIEKEQIDKIMQGINILQDNNEETILSDGTVVMGTDTDNDKKA